MSRVSLQFTSLENTCEHKKLARLARLPLVSLAYVAMLSEIDLPQCFCVTSEGPVGVERASLKFV